MKIDDKELQQFKILNKVIKGDFINARVLITGASSGIGRSCALYMLNCGARVVLCGRDIETLKSIAKQFPDQSTVVKLDHSIDIHNFDLKTTVIQVLGGVDVIINCAGVMFDGDVEKTFPQDFDYTCDVNLRAVYILLTSLKDFLDEGASIVNVSCLAGSIPQAGVISYCMSKAGLEQLTKYAAAEFAEKGIRINAVTSCPVDTNSQRFLGISDSEYTDYKKRVSKNIPLQRMATPDDIVKAIIFLASKRSGKITGHILKVDGGRSLTSSGFSSWKGMRNMNNRFEPDDVSLKMKMGDMWGKLRGTQDTKVIPTDEKEIQKLIDESNFGKEEFLERFLNK
jgi:NAD(P)-dependent dehydrogenase (short-subunit alcohol dehydrogenase family)